jgi:hypothetical protein
MTRTLATIAALCAGLSLAAAPAARAADGDAPISVADPLAAAADPLATDWLGGPVLPGPSEAPVCRAGDPAARQASARTAAQIARIRAQLVADAARAPAGEDEVVVLNNRGYNYDASAVIDPSLVEFEAKRLR